VTCGYFFEATTVKSRIAAHGRPCAVTACAIITRECRARSLLHWSYHTSRLPHRYKVLVFTRRRRGKRGHTKFLTQPGSRNCTFARSESAGKRMLSTLGTLQCVIQQRTPLSVGCCPQPDSPPPVAGGGGAGGGAGEVVPRPALNSARLLRHQQQNNTSNSHSGTCISAHI
jgi:hypothetical protein